MKNLLKEPLLHFLLLGGILFAYFQISGGSDQEEVAESRAEIVITKGKIDSLTEQFVKVWQRQPTTDEIAGLVEDFVREEVMYRESLAMGLDRDDTIVRRRMRQKLEFLTEDIASLTEPDDAELETYLKQNIDAFRRDSVFSFKQVYLNTAQRGDAAEADATALLAQLTNAGPGVEIGELGDRLLLGQVFEDVPQRGVAGKFGTEFAGGLQKIPQGEWAQVSSGYGIHLVLVSKREGGELPVLAEIRDAVARDWASAKREETNEAFYKQLRDRYTVTVESLQGASPASTNKEVATR